MMKRRIATWVGDNRGSALVSVFLVIIVLLVLGAGILALSTANANQARVDNTFERDYYVADGNAKQAAEVLKSAALERYRQIAEDLKNNILTSNNAASFFAYVDAIAYTPPAPDASAGGPNTATVAISHTAPATSTHRYSILSTATDGSTARRIAGSVDITFVPVTLQAGSFTPLGGETILCGGTFQQKSGDITVYNKGTVRFGGYSNPRSNPPTYSNYDGFNLYNKSTGYWIDPNTANTFNWDMKYPGFTVESTTAAAPTFPLVANGGSISSLGGKTAPIYIEGQPGASYKVKGINSGFTSGQILCDGKLTLDSMTLRGSAGSYIKVYASGGMSTSSSVLEYCKLFVDGDLSISGGSDKKNLIICATGNVSISSTGFSNCKIICGGNLTVDGGGSVNNTFYVKGTFTDNSNTRTNVKVYCNSYTMDGGNITGDSIVYAENYIHLESTVSGLFYSGGTIDVGSGSGLTGQMAAKGNIVADGSFSYYPDSTLLARLYIDPFVTSSPGGASGTTAIIQPKNSEIFTGDTGFIEQ